MDKISLKVAQWVEMVRNGADIPIWFRVTGNSMYPLIRANMDDILLVPVKQEELKIGDIVLFPGKYKGGDYCLHRLYKMDGDNVQTFGDGNLRPDHWFPKRNIVGKAVMVKRGKVTIDCDDPKWIRRFRWWNHSWKIRPVMLFPFRVINKCKRIVSKE